MKRDWEIFTSNFDFQRAKTILLPLIAFAVFSTVLYAAFFNVKAQPTDQISEAISLSPVLIEKDVTPSESVELSIKIANSGTQNKTLYLIAADFVGDPQEGGTPKFTTEQTPDSFSTWIELPEKQIQINANERKEVAFKLNVPSGADPGSHYGAVIVSEENPKPEGTSPVAVTSQIATLVFAKVAGEVIEKGETISFTTSKSWYEYPPVNFEVRFENQGNVRTKPTGLIEIYNSAGIKEEVIQINKGFGGVLPHSIRKFEETWNPNKWLNIIPRVGLYRAEGVVTYGLPSTTEKLAPVTFWLLPYKFIGAIAGGILIVIVGFLIFLRLYAQSVISRSKKK
jgi:hypothetical protein